VQLAEPDLLRSMPFLRQPFQALMVAVKRRVSLPLLVAHKGVSVSQEWSRSVQRVAWKHGRGLRCPLAATSDPGPSEDDGSCTDHPDS
jgi:hypothetical protein